MSDTHTKSDVAKREEEVLEFWQQNDIFNKSLEKDSPNGDFVFYDGPPFATGLPHIGSLLSSIIKDVIGRYKTMRGYYVERRWGWDCHGLPIENLVEKELNLKNKKEIYDLGIDKFNEACRAAVLRYAGDWKEYVTRIGRWVEYDSAYKTMDNTYMESVWWFFSQMHERDLLYEGRKVLLYCPHCETPLSKAEIAMDNSYKDITEESVYVKFKVREPEKHNLPEHSYLVAWTTTPWTLPGNIALAVGEDIAYEKIERDGETHIVAKDLVEEIFGDGEKKSVGEVRGKDLVGISYEPLYAITKVLDAGNSYTHTVLPADFVTTEEGTGIVHTAVIYGEDDFELGLKYDIPMVPLLDSAGHFTKDAPEIIHGLYFKKSEKVIKEDITNRGLMLKTEMHTHSYPHCYRCGTALLYNAIVSWFINVQDIRKQMIDTNEDINWFPEHLKHGRYKNIIENAPDWSISRNRFWATPLPIWRNNTNGTYKVFNSLKELQKYVPRSGNRFLIMRHGESTKNTEKMITDAYDAPYPLTDKGIVDVQAAIEPHRGAIDLVVSSPVLRAKETAELVVKTLELTNEQLVFDERIREHGHGICEGQTVDEYYEKYPNGLQKFVDKPEGGENWSDVKKRMGDFLFELEKKYKDKTILIVSHGDPLALMKAAAVGQSREEIVAVWDGDYPKKGVVTELPFVPYPHNREYELDLHRPYIDDLEVFDEDGTKLERIPEVVDCWAESGSMPFAARHYPHSNEEEFNRSFPADFIAEYIAQTRTWFYYMHTVAVLLFSRSSFKNVVTTGNVLAQDGAKMSKSKQNYTDPLVNLNMYGADAMRYYLMSSVVMQAEDASFKDQELKEVHNRLINILWNTYKFYDLYTFDNDSLPEARTSENILDQWIIARLDELIREMTKHMDGYNLTKASRPVRTFVEDFSTWYVRRSRDRFKGTDESDKAYAIATTRYIFIELSKLLAPIMPFMAESLYRNVGGQLESVHLDTWPDEQSPDEKILDAMATTREVVSRALEARASANIKVRQPLSKLTVKQDSAALYEPYLSLIKDEVNVKEVTHDESIAETVFLDATITPELQKEGDAREFIRQIQDARKKSGLQPQDVIVLHVQTSDDGKEILTTFADEIKATVGASDISFGGTEGEEINVGEQSFTIKLVKV